MLHLSASAINISYRCNTSAVGNFNNFKSIYNLLWSIEFKLSSPKPSCVSIRISSAFSRRISLISFVLAITFCVCEKWESFFQEKSKVSTYTNVVVWFSRHLKLGWYDLLRRSIVLIRYEEKLSNRLKAEEMKHIYYRAVLTSICISPSSFRKSSFIWKMWSLITDIEW